MGQTDQVHPSVSSIQKPGLLEKIGGVAGIAGGLAGALNGSSLRSTPQQTGMGSQAPNLLTTLGYLPPLPDPRLQDPTYGGQ